MTITSNIRFIIERLEKFKKGLPEAIRRAIAPERWFDDLREQARFALTREMPGVEEQGRVEDFLNLMGRAFLGNTAQWWMEAPQSDASTAAQAALRGASGPGGAMERMQPQVRTGNAEGIELDLLDRVSVAEAMEMVRQWVMAGAAGDADGKRLTAEDQEYLQRQGQYDNLLVERVWRVFGIHPAYLGQVDIGLGEVSKQEEAIKGLTRHIVEYFAAKGGAAMPSDRAEALLRKVLDVWTKFMSANLPGAIQEEIQKLKAEG